jgi:hypothetical protein
MVDKVSGNPKVFEEARERKRGGKAMMHEKEHEKHKHKKRARGGKADCAEGDMAKMRMDRPRRARGGAAGGSNKHPFSSAHHASSPEKGG